MVYDKFKNNKFNYWDWSAEEFTSYEKAAKFLEGCKLVGRKIKNIHFIGMDYAHDKEMIEDTACLKMEDEIKDEETLFKLCEFDNIPYDFEFDRWGEIDEPIIFEFDDGDTFEVLFRDMISFPVLMKMAMNTIDLATIEAGINCPSIIAGKLFSNCLGRSIVKVEAQKAEDGASVGAVFIRLDNGEYLKINAWYDFCRIDCFSDDDKPVKITFRDLKKAILR